MGEEDPGLTTVYYSVLSPADVAKVRSWTWVLKCAVQTMTCSFLILSGSVSSRGRYHQKDVRKCGSEISASSERSQNGRANAPGEEEGHAACKR